MEPAVFAREPLAGHELIDSGGGRRLERFGELVVDRPDPQALWRPATDAWREADLVFVRESDRGGRFEIKGRQRSLARRALDEGVLLKGAFEPLPELAFVVRPTPFKHLGVFPEQAVNWRRLVELREAFGRAPRLLNLFGYSGIASVAAALAGYEVTHVDASKSAVNWCRENAAASGVERGVRFICEDALAFAEREARRGNRYDAILLDPPHYGRGPKGQKWTLEVGLAPLLEAVRGLLEPRAVCVLSTYAVGYSPLAFRNMFDDFEGGRTDAGELVLVENGAAGRLLPCGFCARFERDLP